MSKQANIAYYQNADPTINVATVNSPQVHANPYGAPLPNAYSMSYPPTGAAYNQPPPPILAYADTEIMMQRNRQDINRIRDYMVWSIINIFLGGLFLGLIAVLFSYITKTRKENQNIQSARRWSLVTLIYNVFVDLVTIAIVIFLIVFYTSVYRNQQTYIYGN